MCCTDDEVVVDSVEYDRRVAALSDSLTMSLMIGVDATLMLLHQLTRQLHAAVQRLQLLVPDTIYLPAPPVYCPQPAVTVEVRDYLSLMVKTHTHTHNRFTALWILSWTTRVSRYQQVPTDQAGGVVCSSGKF